MSTPREPWTGFDTLAVLVCSSAIMLVSLDGTIVNVALPSLQRSFHATSSDLQWTVDAYVLLRCSVLFLSGATGDRFGRRRCFTIGLWMFGAGTLACALSPNIDTLIGFRAFQGLGSAVLTPSSLAILTNSFPDRRKRAMAVGIWGALSSSAQSAGPLLGGALVQAFGWRAVFYVNLPIAFCSLMGIRRMAESKSAVPRPFDVPGQASIGLGLFALTYALIAGPDIGWATPIVIGLFFAFVALWSGFVVAEKKSKHPMIPLAYFRIRSLTGSGLLGLFASMITGGFIFFNSLYLQEVRGFTPLHAGLLSVPLTAAGLGIAPLSGYLTGTRGPRLPASVALGFMAAAMLLMYFALGENTSVWELLLGYLLLGIGSGLVNTPITNGAISGMPRDQAGVSSAVATTGRQTGLNLGVALLGSVVFSVASRSSLTGGTPGHPMAAAPANAFISGVRDADLLSAGLGLVGIFVALWAYSKRQEERRTVEAPSVATRAAS